ncbi:hypothetical protein [Haloarcula marismortui]|jgi:hypothetical protein|uniref:Uncharacterized protein n=1 Tax=Haloarcula marismortui ATCC 33799 TaxID=662475 RepID=M0K2J2_9EURY|nr:hypothetical protein [Haloarcula californiae]EMA15426.1 hypothetical protein C435_14158 [Haloarcula californiae ATCC 33799]
MENGGLFVSLYDKDTLKLYLDKGIYGQHMTPEREAPSSQSRHFNTLADYAACREGRHVFFFLDREIYYGGQLVGEGDGPAFYLNGQYSPLGREVDAPFVWDESSRYDEHEEDGLFETDRGEKCQPFLIQFEDNEGLSGRYITSDQFYIDLSEYPYPVPSNSMEGMGFCTLTARETEMLLDIYRDEDAVDTIETDSEEDIQLEGEPLPYETEYGPDSVTEVQDESHLEASILADPSLLPTQLQPDEDALLCRQVPVCPYKPPQHMDKADVCYFTEDGINDGTFPNTIIELKYASGGDKPAGKSDSLQMKRYAEWIDNRLDEQSEDVELFIYSPPGFTSTFDDYIPEQYLDWITKIETTVDDKQQTF